MLSRRHLLVTALVSGGALMVGCAPADRQQRRDGAEPGLPASDPAAAARSLALNGWIRVAADGVVSVALARSELGQGSHTGLLMLVAEELDLDPAQLHGVGAPIDRLYGNVTAIAEGVPFRPDDDGLLARTFRWGMVQAARQFGFSMTGGSSSLRDLWQPLREAAAVTRATLVEAAARRWNLAPEAIRTEGGRMRAPDGRSMGYGEAVVALGPNPRPASAVRLKDPAAFRVIGHPVPRLDAAAKSTGRAVFGIDVRQPGQLYAAVRMAPVLGGAVQAFEAGAAATRPGVRQVMAVEPPPGGSGGVAVVAESWWTAKQALEDVTVRWTEPAAASAFDSAKVHDRLAAALQRDGATDPEAGFTWWKRGTPAEALAGAVRRIEAEYRAPLLAHLTLEPMNCTVRHDGERASVWVPTQVPGFARRAAATVLGLPEERVEVQVTLAGGGFGRRLETDVVHQAAQIARRLPGVPVQLLWSREEDLRHDFYRPPSVARLQAGFDARGGLVAWHQVSAGPSVTAGWLPRNVGLPVAGPDKTTAEGAFDAAYEFPSVRVGHVTVDLPVPVGYWRSVGHSHQAFFKESFADECAQAAGVDPLRWRLDLLQRQPRVRAVLQRAAREAGWGRALPPAPDGAPQARGLALHESFGSVVAQVAEVSIGPDRQIRVHRVVCAIDCGTAVNPRLVAQQMEGAVVDGLSAALHGEVRIERGRVIPGNFDQQPVLRLPDAPQVETHVMPSAAPPAGVGEPGLPPIAPAVANALAALTGQRLRSLPLRLPAGAAASSASARSG